MAPGVGDAAHLERLETIFRLAPLGVGIVDMGGHTVMANDTLRLLLGYSGDEFASMAWSDYTHPDDVARNVELFDRMHAGEFDHFSMEKRFICKDGSLLWVNLTSSMVRDADGQPSYLIGMVQDISRHKRLERDLRTAEQHYRLLVERVPAVVYIADAGAEATWHYVSPQIEEMLGFTPEEWQADPRLWLRQVHPDDRSGPLAEEDRVLLAECDAETHSTSYRIRHRDGRVVWVRDDAVALRGPDGGVTWHGVLVDVTREKQLEDRLGHQALHDPLTGLPNRRLFHERVEQALDRARARDGSVTVLFVDLDHFKTVNDSFGHGYGDKVIVTAGRRIRGCVRTVDTAARLGGDEFALLVEDATAAGGRGARRPRPGDAAAARRCGWATSPSPWRPASASPRPAPGRPPTRCCATPTWRCTAPNGRAAAAGTATTTACTTRWSAASGWRRRCRPRWPPSR